MNDEPQRGCGGVKLLEFPAVKESRGNLVFAQFPNHLPFQPKRFFVTYDVPLGSARGEHAHRLNEQIIVCLRGSLTVMVDDGTVKDRYLLDSPGIGLYIPRGIWGTQSYHSVDCLMLVLASEGYDESGYIRDYSEFLDYVKRNRPS